MEDLEDAGWTTSKTGQLGFQKRSVSAVRVKNSNGGNWCGRPWSPNFRNEDGQMQASKMHPVV